ncbi:MAG: 23S rRNA (pseudouridine(1915)-N(3))-methyltransferase RlmH [Clostridia bacterium]|nr:23S rRNA (pseudouridine(1915)-N(3))-methyltransferase RlmH [Clostridia bacterium]
MRIKIVCVGRLKEKYLREACAEYEKRISGFGRVSIIEVQDENDSLPAALSIEADRIMRNIKETEHVITLEIGGEPVSSEGLAARMSELAVRGISDIAFIIGGSNGLHPSVSERADQSLSLSNMTFPHQLARVILLEQIYRAYKINNNEKYHK